MGIYYVYPQRSKRGAVRKQKKPRALRQREINPDTGKPFRDRRSRIVGGRVICKGADMADLRERTGRREGELCQGCEGWAPIYPPEGTIAGEMHHRHGRGMGSSKRNDILSEQMWLCGGPSGCHRKAKIEPLFRAGDEA